MIRRAVLLIASMLATASLAGTASAAPGAFFPAVAIDGPSSAIVAVGDVDVARDGSGALVWTRVDGGASHVLASRLVNGTWQPPERIDPALDASASQPVVAAADGGRLVVAFVSGGQVFYAVRAAGATAWPAPVAVGAGANPSLDMSVNGVAYLVWSAAGDVRAARLDRQATGFAGLPDALDVTPAAIAGEGTGRPRVAVAADGIATAAWGEGGHVYARRMYDRRISTAPQQVDVAAVKGLAGGAAELPDIDSEDDSSYAWTTFRQALADGRGHVLARRLRGSLFDDAVDLGPASEDAGTPRIDLNGRGQGLVGASGASTGSVFGAALQNDAFLPVLPLSGPNAVDPRPVPAMAEGGDGVVAWMQGVAADAVGIHARFIDDGKPDLEGDVNDPALGPVDPAGGLEAAANRAGDVVIAFVQGAGDQRRIVVGSFDRQPGTFRGTTTTHWRKSVRPPLRWSAAFELWGPVTYTVRLDGQDIGTTSTIGYTPVRPIADGVHRWSVTASDRRGQRTVASTRQLRVDTVAPRVTVRTSGDRTAGRAVTFRARATDEGGSGVRTVSYAFGDGSPVATGSVVRHAFSAGSHRVTVTVTDRVGNARKVSKRVNVG